MSKFLRTAALVVGGIALAATGVGAIVDATVGLAGAATIAGVSTVVIAETAAVASAGLGILAQITAKKPKPIGNPMQWQSDPQAGIPIVAGRAYSGGKIVYRQGWGSDNKWETIHTVYSIGPIKGFDQFYVDGVATSIGTDTTVNIHDRGFMFARTQIGAQPETAALQVGQGSLPPGLTSASKLSGLAASAVQLVYDTKGKTTLSTEPQAGFVLEGVRVYDPRRDDTYPGGSGSQRWNDELTWSYVGFDNPYLFGLAWLIGWRQSGKLVAGVGVPISAIILEQYVEGANVADANGWKMGGVLDTTDNKWQRLKDVLLAGGGEPLRLGAQIGCLINTPRVSLAMVGLDDLAGDVSVQNTQAMRDRINAVVPRYMAEQSTITQDTDGSLKTTVTWGMAAAGPIVIADYVAFDGKQRQTQIDFEFVQGPGGGGNAPTQVAQLARYAIENAREFGPIVMPLKLRWMGYKPGDVVTVNLPEMGLVGQDVLLLNRGLDPSKGAVTMTARSETYAKHAFALGQTTTAPGTPSLSGPVLVAAPAAGSWAIVADAISSNGTTIPALVITGAADSSTIDSIVFEYRVANSALGPDDAWQSYGYAAPSAQECVITGLRDNTAYEVSITYRRGSASSIARLILGPSTVSSTALPWSGIGGDNKPEDGATRNVYTGPYDPNRIYKYGDEVSDQLAVWRYTNILSEKGNPPPTLPTESNDFWSLFVQGASQDIINAVAGMVSDQVLARSEKLALINDIAAIQSEEPKLAARASGLSLDPSGYVAAYTALMSFLGGLSPAWDDTTHDTPLPDKTTLTARVEAYFSQRDALTGTINDQADQEIAITSEAAAAAKAAADAANTLAGTANAAASLGAQMAADIADNGKFSPAEKKRWVERINSFNGTVASEIAQGNQLGLQAQTGALQTAYNNLISYLNSVGYSDVGHTSSINSATFKANVAAFDNAETNLAVAAQAYAQSMSVITTNNLIVDPLFQRPTDAGSWQQPTPSATSTGQDDRLGRRVVFNPSSGDVGWLTPTFQCTGNDRLDIDFDWFCSSGVVGVNGGTSFGIWASGFDSNGNALWNNAVTVPFSGTKNQWLRTAGSIIVANQANGANTQKVFVYVQAQGHSGGAVYVRNPRGVKAAAANALIGADGRGTTSTLSSTNGVAGVRSLNLTGFQLSQVNAGSSVTINISASQYALDTGVVLNYPSGSFGGGAYSTQYYVWRSDPQLNGGTGYGISTNLNDALAPGNVYLGYIITMSSAGTGGGGGGYGTGDCVGPLAWIEVEGIGPVQAKDILPGHRILCLTEDKLGFEFVEVESNEPGENTMVELATEFGPRLQLSINTPMPRQDTDEVYGIAAWAHLSAVATKDLGNEGAPVWVKPSVHAVGHGRCQQIVCHQRIYGAGAEPGRYIFSHNGVIQKP